MKFAAAAYCLTAGLPAVFLSAKIGLAAGGPLGYLFLSLAVLVSVAAGSAATMCLKEE